MTAPSNRATFMPLLPYRQKTPSLCWLEQALRLAEWGRASPRHHHVSGIAVIAALCTAALKSLLSWAGLEAPPYFLPAAFGVAVLVAFWRWRGPASWPELLDQELARYEPCDVEAFKSFQAYCRAQGGIDFAEMRSWLDSEQQALTRRQVRDGQRERPSQFLSRNL